MSSLSGGTVEVKIVEKLRNCNCDQTITLPRATTTAHIRLSYCERFRASAATRSDDLTGVQDFQSVYDGCRSHRCATYGPWLMQERHLVTVSLTLKNSYMGVVIAANVYPQNDNI